MRRYLIALIAAAFLMVGAAPAEAACGSSTSTAILGLKKIAGAKNWWECLDDNADVLDTQLVVEYVSSTATAGAATTLTDTTQSWSVDLWINKIVKITGGAGSGQSRSIASNTATVLTVSSAWDTNPDATSTYKILAGGGVTDHGLLSGLADDDHTQYHTDARGDARYYTETELDAGQLDGQYFQESEFLNTSAGAGDAGKPIKLDAGGLLDASMIDDADVDHGSIGGLGDDDHTQYHNDARGDARYYTETELDAGQLDGQYFQESEFLNTSAGAGDAGKPIKLDAGGLLDASMIDDADVDHGSIGGLADDDHTQYHTDARGDARYFTESEFLNTSAGAGDAGKPIKLDAGGLIDASMVDDADVDHGTTTGLGDDDHAQYHNDARGDARYVELGGDTMTGLLVLSADPAAALGAATKQYVDAVGNITAIGFIIDGGGSAITTGPKGDLRIPFGCTINRATALADQSGSIVVDIWKDTYANFPPTDADSITASAPVTISSATKSEDSTLTGWTTSISADDILRYNVDSVTSITRVTVSLKCTKS
ncbi:MAG: hypothetical protein RX318_01855 [bacterium]|nr:hypothetical protein [bacterium]